jgi:hypothetical protein
MKSETFRTEGTAMADMTDDERRHAEMKMRHERAHRMRQRLVKQQETEMNDDEWVRIAKRIAAGQETRICKRQWHEQIVKRAADDRRENETPEQRYSRFLCETSDGAALYQAYRLAPQGDEAEPARTVTPTMPAPTPSYERLMGKAEELRKSDPKLTEAQSFAKVYEAPENRDLVEAVKRERTEQYASSAPLAGHLPVLRSP